MKCPSCGKINYFKVIDTRSRDRGDIYRRRKCLSCGNKITTSEKIVDSNNDAIDMKDYEKLIDLVQNLKIAIIKLGPKEVIE